MIEAGLRWPRIRAIDPVPMIDFAAPDLTQHPPRSPRVRLGGFVHLPRLLDKARAFAAGRNGDYNYNCGLDQRFFAFTGIDADAFLDEVKIGRTDTEMLGWVERHTTTNPAPYQIAAWSSWLENRGPGDAEGHARLRGSIEKNGPEREDIRSFFDNLDLDDYVSFGGKA
jgi:hypothetical protein